MDTKIINGKKVAFHDAEHAHRFFSDGKNIHVAQSYLDAARRGGESKFYTPDGNKYRIEHDKDSDEFHVRWVPSS